jgi:carboxyl-terminal processing protease
VSSYKNSSFSIRLPLLIGIALASGIFIGANMFGPKPSRDINVISQKFREILTYIDRDYVDTVDTDKLVEKALGEMLSELDPHSSYIPPKDLTLVQSQLEGNFEGIGIEFNIVKDTIYVVTPISGGPSEAVGLQAGDKIVTVDGKNVAGNYQRKNEDGSITEAKIQNRDVFDLLRGPKGTRVTVGVLRGQTTNAVEYTIIRDKIPNYSVDVSYMLDNQTGYIKISRFAATTYDEFLTALTGLKKKGMKRLMLDLRGNPGGYMDRATNIADELLDGNQLIVYTQGKQIRYNSEVRALRPGNFETGAVIVLVDEGSASASEIVAGAIQDNDRGLIVGRRTFGKGLVQYPFPLSDKSELRLTISRYYTPSGRSIQKPYTPGGENDYEMDIMNRFRHGEFFHADSIKFDENLKYKTSKGRTIYGGGGVMPDIFVPRDTSQFSPLYEQLWTNNVLREYALEYYNAERKKLEKMGLSAFVSDFQVSDAMLKVLLDRAKTLGVTYQEAHLNRSEKLIRTILKAYIGKSAFKNEGFFPVLLQEDEIFAQAVKRFPEAENIYKK